ncbi:MAG: hypothetical protein ACOY0T_31275 [Myxococcota bacterium]
MPSIEIISEAIWRPSDVPACDVIPQRYRGAQHLIRDEIEGRASISHSCQAQSSARGFISERLKGSQAGVDHDSQVDHGARSVDHFVEKFLERLELPQCARSERVKDDKDIAHVLGLGGHSCCSARSCR